MNEQRVCQTDQQLMPEALFDSRLARGLPAQARFDASRKTSRSFG
nr:MAG TPA: hypothetical protein [Caudoviricetes sp.]